MGKTLTWLLIATALFLALPAACGKEKGRDEEAAAPRVERKVDEPGLEPSEIGPPKPG